MKTGVWRMLASAKRCQAKRRNGGKRHEIMAMAWHRRNGMLAIGLLAKKKAAAKKA